jgi:hypothetical protein
VHANALAYLRDIGVEDLHAAPPLTLSCECLRLGCAAEVKASPGAFSAVLSRPGRYAIIRGHQGPGEAIVDDVGDASVVEARTAG